MLSRRNWVLLHQNLMGMGSHCLHSMQGPSVTSGSASQWLTEQTVPNTDGTGAVAQQSKESSTPQKCQKEVPMAPLFT